MVEEEGRLGLFDLGRHIGIVIGSVVLVKGNADGSVVDAAANVLITRKFNLQHRSNYRILLIVNNNNVVDVVFCRCCSSAAIDNTKDVGIGGPSMTVKLLDVEG